MDQEKRTRQFGLKRLMGPSGRLGSLGGLPTAVVLLCALLLALSGQAATEEQCRAFLSSRACNKEPGCVWYEDGGAGCHVLAYCHPTWDLVICENVKNIGACVHNGTECVRRSELAGTVNAGLNCLAQCNKPGTPEYQEGYTGNRPCSPFCGAEGFCCNSFNPVGCAPVECTTEFCCARPGTLSPTFGAPSRSPTYTQPSFSPTALTPTSQAPSLNPTYKPSLSPTDPPFPTLTPTVPTGSPTASPSSSAPSNAPSDPPTFSPTSSPTVSAPTVSPTLSMPTASPSLPTPSPSRAPTTPIQLHPDDQLAWQAFRTAFRDRFFCGNLDVPACNACGDMTSSNRQIVCDYVPLKSEPSRGLRRRVQEQYEIRIIEIRMRNSNLTGPLPVNVLSDYFPNLRLLDLGNDGEDSRNQMFYIGESACLPLDSCTDGRTTCILPEGLPPVCGSTAESNSKGGLTTPIYVVIGVSAFVLLVFAFVCFAYVRTRRRAKSHTKRSLKPRNSAAASSRQSLASRKSTTSMGERRVSFLDNPALIYKPDPSKIDGSRKRRRSSLSSKEKKQWQIEYDPSTGRQYWLNRRTMEFSWVGPDGEVDEDEEEPAPPPFPQNVEVEEDVVRVPIFQDTGDAHAKRGRGMKSDQWETVYDEETNSRYMVNRESGEFVALGPESDDGNAFYTNISNDDDEEEDDHDPLWKVVIDPETNEWYWIDVESGEVTFEEPVTGTIVSAEMLEATGRYSWSQIQMVKPLYIKRPTGISVTSDGSKERRRSSGLRSFTPRRSSGLDTLDLGNRRPSGGLHDPNGSKSSGMFSRIMGRSASGNSEEFTLAVRQPRFSDDDDDDDDSDDDDEVDSDLGQPTRYGR